jgi:8-oxo-dGTP pyrophosphatase MutT (NUDIX family)
VYVPDDMIAAMAARYGEPHRRRFDINVTAKELARIRSSQRDGRNHDVTLYIRKGDQLIVMAKHVYPPDLYRAPSGGIKPGEDFEAGINREVAEETGCLIALDKFLMQTDVWFHHEGDSLYWRSFVFTADYVEGDFNYTDFHEIRQVRLARWDEFESFGRIMRSTDLGGLHYRAALHEAVVELLNVKG